MSNEKEQLSYDQIISLLSIYQSDYEHRDSMLWSHTFTFFYISIFIMIIPNIVTYLSINLPPISPKLFPIMGVFVATIAYLFSLSHQKRLEASTKTFEKFNDLLPEKYQRVNVKDLKHGKYFTGRQAIIIPSILYMISFFIAITLTFIQ